ncbi:LysR substrate-binding domain-containing protein [Plastoroseomonas arctica]|uniref:LysR substrate-binding domain-containing protein n=1 Tax=Plastoroseomonas arctica TaxID=1509237 RepID=A0AAF1JX12_9PROT|nr:LysR substrate-binding domain-containing protein [Plastoroseomonas arctica]MBR0655777.1 hypothetical protein [Plastoroseomonas arctica]
MSITSVAAYTSTGPTAEGRAGISQRRTGDAFASRRIWQRVTWPGLYDAILAACRTAGLFTSVLKNAPRLPATLSLVAAGLGISLVPASMRRLAVAGVTYRGLEDGPGLLAPIRLVLRMVGASATSIQFAAAIKRLAANARAPMPETEG